MARQEIHDEILPRFFLAHGATVSKGSKQDEPRSARRAMRCHHEKPMVRIWGYPPPPSEIQILHNKGTYEINVAKFLLPKELRVNSSRVRSYGSFSPQLARNLSKNYVAFGSVPVGHVRRVESRSMCAGTRLRVRWVTGDWLWHWLFWIVILNFEYGLATRRQFCCHGTVARRKWDCSVVRSHR
jgi:hypothetical protein